MRRPVAVLLGLCAAAVVVLALAGVGTKERRAFTLGVAAAGPVATLQPGQVVCQEPVAIPDADATFDRVGFSLGTFSRPGPPIDVTVRATGGGFVTHGRLAGGYADRSRAPTPSVDVGRVALRGQGLRVCLRNAGATKAAVYGSGPLASRTSDATKDGKPLAYDIALVFEHAQPRSALSLVPSMFERASLWRTGWTAGWTYVLLALGLVLAVPALLAVALRDASS